MILAASFLMIAQSAAPVVVEKPAQRATPIAVATARARVLRPARIQFDLEDDGTLQSETTTQAVQRGRDDTGTVWIEFS